MKPLHNGSFLLIILSTLFFSISYARDTITSTQPLTDNETLVSSDGSFALGFFTPTNSNNRYIGLWYKTIPLQTIVWVANRDKPIINSTGLLSITSKGALMITDNSSTVIWSANVTSLSSAVAQLLDTGNFVVKNSDDNSGNYAWQGFDYPTDTLIPGMKIGVVRTTGLNLTTTSWNSNNDPSPGTYYAFMDIQGDPELYLYSGSQKIWRSGAWNGVQFSGITDLSSNEGFTFNFTNDNQEVTYSYGISNRSVVSMLWINPSGVIQRRVWLWDSAQWNVFWYAPKDPCDNYGKCGPYGACNPNNAPVCECLLPVFTPANPANWQLRDGSEGCVRETKLDCKNGTDGFLTVNNVKLPESDNSTVYNGFSLDLCKAACLTNCLCTAYASANIRGGGSGCVIWNSQLVDIRLYVGSGSGQDLYVRVSAADIDYNARVLPEHCCNSKSCSPLVMKRLVLWLETKNVTIWTAASITSHKSKSTIVAIVVSVIAGLLLLACVGCFLWRRKKKKQGLINLGATPSFNDQSNAGAKEENLDLPIFDFSTIMASTDHFSAANKLGEGGFGPVYKGKFEDAQEIAVKRLAKTSVQGLEEFKNEVVLIAKLQHRNLVRLLGCCIQGEERMLIYEYMPNKSLDAFLFEKGKGALLDWKTRYQIILGISRGLLYLHQDSRFRIIHRDLKASNILLDKDMNPKISDFGMARIFGGDETDFNTRKVVGTYGYMSPEYAMDGVFSVKSDVFSFGVLVLEIISGKKNRGVYAYSPYVNLLAHAWSLWREGKSMQLVDESMSYSFPMDEVLRCIKVGLLCVQERPEDRPLMSSVILMLGSDITSLPQPKQPGFAARRGPFETDSSSSKQDSSTVNDITVTMSEGR